MKLTPEAIFSIWLSIKIVGVSVFLFLTLGSFLAFYISNENTISKKIISFLVDLPLAFPPIVTGFLLLWMFSNNSVIGEFLNKLNIKIVFSFTGLVIASFIAGIPLYVKPIVSAIKQFPKNIKEASYIAGKSKSQTFLFVILPNIKKTFAISLLLSVSRVIGEVGISLMIGGNIPFKTNTISLEIFTSVFNADLSTAFHLSVILFVISMAMFIVLKIFESKTDYI